MSVRSPRGTNKPGDLVEDGAAAAEVALPFFGSLLFFSKLDRSAVCALLVLQVRTAGEALSVSQPCWLRWGAVGSVCCSGLSHGSAFRASVDEDACVVAYVPPPVVVWLSFSATGADTQRQQPKLARAAARSRNLFALRRGLRFCSWREEELADSSQQP